ncbi:MAG: bifunctional UDP-N-acetylglucosamine diphosphorylase/glucosamine-1-phosphate N-acetyltransferase GlmU [Peptococcia bacterium]
MTSSVAVVLAAGLGTRMKSTLPKVLHQVAGWPMLKHISSAIRGAGVENIILVLGHQSELVEETMGDGYCVAYQKEQLGTGHALLQALPFLEEFQAGQCLVVCGDTPLLTAETLKALREKQQNCNAEAIILTAEMADPTGYGRIVKKDGQVLRIVEEKDAGPEEKPIKEINTGTYCFKIEGLKRLLPKLSPTNAQGEYYLTDIISLLAQEGKCVETHLLADPNEAMGINNRVQLAEAEKLMRRRINEQHMLAGVTMIDPENTYIEAGVEIGQDTIIYPGVHLVGKTKIGSACEIGPDCRIVDSAVAKGTLIKYSYLSEAEVGEHCTIGPYSYLRPGTVLANKVKVGDFSEIKNSFIGEGSKIPHLSYIGDSSIGKGVNIGAGTITCNYDGVKKFPTYIGDGTFVGSNSNLVAPLTVGAGAYIGAGSTVTKDIPAGALAVARGRQRNIDNWRERLTLKAGQDKQGED